MKRVFIAALCFAALLGFLRPAQRVCATPVTYSFFPARPASSSELSTTVGTLEAYQVHSGSVSYATLTINDETTRTKRMFYIALPFHVNGEIMQCSETSNDNVIAQLHVCTRLPQILNHASIVVVYWPVKPAAFFKGGFATDSVTTARAVPSVVTIGRPYDELSRQPIRIGPQYSGVSFSVTPAVLTTRLKHPAVVSLWFNNVTQDSVSLCVGVFSQTIRFLVLDSAGKAVPSHQPPDYEGGEPFHCGLPPNVQWRFQLPINDFTNFPGPGKYTVFAQVLLDIPQHKRWVNSNPITVYVTQ